MPVRYRLVGGKGGTGKTTCAAALALAEASRGCRTLLITTDPAPSLGDALGIRLSGSPRRVPAAAGRLAALELDAASAMRRWLRSRADTLETVAVRGTWLDRDDVRSLFGLALPGLDELMALLELARLGRSGRYDLIVIDTAPTGHALRMLTMPDTLAGLASVFDHMQAKHRVMVEALRGAWPGDAADDLVRELFADAADLRAWMSDAARFRTAWVTLPEPMAIAETRDALAALDTAGLLVDRVIVNRVTPAGERCAWCDAQRALDSRAVRDLAAAIAFETATAPRLSTVIARDEPPAGVRPLHAVAKEIEAEVPPPSVRRAAPARAGVVAASASGIGLRHERPWELPGAGSLRLVLFGGKGGVGKTTCAAAAAVDAARRHPDRRVLLLSTDPAHSLGDALGVPLSDVPGPLPGAPANLFARELDAARAIEAVRQKYRSSVDRVFDRLRGGSAFDAAHDRRVMHELIDLAPPGLDELAAMAQVTDLLEEGSPAARFELVIVDTAPTGHALRLLEMPGLVQSWARALMRILLKYQAVMAPGEIGALLLQLSQSLGRLRDLIQDARRAAFLVVTRPEPLVRAETVRLIRGLAALRMAVPAVIANAVGRGSCGRCRAIVRGQAAEMRQLSRATGGPRKPRLVVAPGHMPPPGTARELERWRQTWSEASAGRPGPRRRTPSGRALSSRR